MINLLDGNITIDSNYILSSKLTFDEFKLSNYYDNQNKKKMFYLKGTYKIDANFFHVSLYFENEFLKNIHLILEDDTINEYEELKRKEKHDILLNKDNVDEGNEYNWGSIVSVYDRRSNTSLIVLTY